MAYFLPACHTYVAVIQHGPIQARGIGPTKGAAIKAAIEKYSCSRACTDERVEYVEKLGQSLIAQWRDETRKAGVPLRMLVKCPGTPDKPGGRIAMERI